MLLKFCAQKATDREMAEGGQTRVFRRVGRPRQGGRPHPGPLRLPSCQRTQQSDPVLRRNGPVPEDRPLRQESRLHAGLRVPSPKCHENQPRAGVVKNVF